MTNAGKKIAARASEFNKPQLQPKSAGHVLRNVPDAPPRGGPRAIQVAFTNSDDAAPPSIALSMKLQFAFR
jgi:hypothetical protein